MLKILALMGLLACSSISPMSYVHGVPNLDRVDDNIWRSGQITTQEGVAYIQQLAAGRHVHVIKLNFDNEGSDAPLAAAGFEVHPFPVQPEGDQDLWDDLESVFKGPDPKQIDGALAVLLHCKQNPTTEMCLGHCTHGQDRTGFLFGKYRVLIDGWPKSEAYAEMLAHHFHAELHGVHEAWEAFSPPRLP